MKILSIFIVLFIIGVAVVFLSSNQEGFTGSRIKNPDSYMLDIEKMNGTTIYRGNGKETTDFTVNIPESGALLRHATQKGQFIFSACR